MRDGRVLHALQPAAGAPDPDPPHRLQHVLQAEELQDGGLVREAPPRAGAKARGRPADQEDTTGTTTLSSF